MKMFSATDSSGTISGSWWMTRMPAACASRAEAKTTGRPSTAMTALVRAVLALQDPQQRRLAGPVLAHQRRHLRRPAGPGYTPLSAWTTPNRLGDAGEGSTSVNQLPLAI